ncbi:glyoxalase [Lentzea tibetensis]|uniref:Glyoxalase n=2 Tax=Lentzea tibetensis TaxID=2591470 RepID=A0A563EYM9_9PSEU|nr:VOC family protein [Lentzea tibetensis]TWP52244.1 glyoxalase [Lentzea tibetensis]
MTPSIPRFHLAVPVTDLEASRAFYGAVLGCPEGRSSDRWIDWNLYGHQFVTHLVDSVKAPDAFNPVDGHSVPVPHFGVLLSVDEFQVLAEKLESAGTDFVIAPYQRFAGEPGEQWTMFFRDPSGNAIEVKAFADDAQVFAV